MKGTRHKTTRVKAVAKLTGRSVETIWRSARQGCDLNSPASINEFLEGNTLRQSPNLIRKWIGLSAPNGAEPSDLNQIELGPIGKLGAAALQRLESAEEGAHARLMREIESGNGRNGERKPMRMLQILDSTVVSESYL